jgi:predicted anti-sigma-YlaC factor YlaD
VDCAEIRQGFLTGEVPSGPSVDEHVARCPHCPELFQNAAALGRRLAIAATELPDATEEQLARAEAAIAGERGMRAFLRSRPTRIRWLLSLSLPALLMLRELSHRRVPWRLLTTPRLLAGAVLVGLLALVAHSALRPLPIERRAARLRSSLALVAWCLPCVLWFVPQAQASGDDGNFALRSFVCFAYGSALAAPSFALLWALDRGVYVPFRVWALAAGVVALVANLILILHCPVTGRAHLAAGHFSIGLAWFAAVSTGEWWRRRA